MYDLRCETLEPAWRFYYMISRPAGRCTRRAAIFQDMDRTLFAAGAVFGLLGVGAGAFGAHALKGRLDAEMMQIYDTAVRYHLVHALAILACGLATLRYSQTPSWCAGVLFSLGILIFSGSLYALCLTGLRWLGAITPLGGLAFLAGWGCLIWAAFSSRA